MKKSLNIQGRILDLSHPVVMGILNITPDSFFERSRFIDNESLFLEKAAEMIRAGAGILDIGGYSTRPGAKEISSAEEKSRVVPAVRLLKSQFPDLVISIDTFRADVAEACIGEGADIINDVSGGDLDERMFDVISESKVPYILMHMRGKPSEMQNHIQYNNFLTEVCRELQYKVSRLHKKGISDLIIDPGFGFSKTLDQNYILLKHLSLFEIFDLPILAGLSRKSMIYKLFDIRPEESLNATTALNMFALTRGASILRVHDVAEARQTADLFVKLSNS
jgi:dihydropteroate synthase